MEGFEVNSMWNIQHVAHYFDVHPMTVYRWAGRGEIPMFKVGGQWRARKEDIENFVAKSVKKTVSTEDKKI